MAAPTLPFPLVPSGGLRLGRRRPVQLHALLAVRNEIDLLPGLIANLGPQVDGVIALDDGSTDGSAEFLEAQASVVEVIRVPASRPAWDEVANHQALVAAALRNGGGWLLSIDADERVEREFRLRAERVIRRGALARLSAFAVRIRELWDSPVQYRCDGVWGHKRSPRLFLAREDHSFDMATLHGSKAPLQGARLGRFPLADLNLYHLAMLTPAARLARRRRYEEADPGSRWQRMGYAYLTDETGLRLREIPPRRMYVDLVSYPLA